MPIERKRELSALMCTVPAGVFAGNLGRARERVKHFAFYYVLLQEVLRFYTTTGTHRRVRMFREEQGVASFALIMNFYSVTEY